MSNYNTLKTADTINAVSIVDGAITTSKLNASVTTLIGSGGGPKVTAITYPGNDLSADPAGGQTITLTGTGFVSGCSVFIGTTQASVVTVVSATSVTFTAPALAAATYTLYLVNPDGGTATIVPGISYSGTPIWSTTAGTLGSVYEYSPISNATTATGDGSISYSVFSGTLPTGSSLNTSTGVITGTSPASAGATTYTFVIRATDAQLQDTDRTFSITVNTDAVTWTTPAANSTVTLGQSLASTNTLLATSAAGNAITYTSTTLPTGLSISGATVTGTPTVVGNTTSTFTATAATTNRTATAVINWTVSVSGDTYFPYTTLLLSGATATETFIADASTNNFAVTIAGDTKPNNFNPYTPGYYSNYFNGSSNFTSSTSQIVPTGSFTVECWVYVTSTANQAFVAQGTSANAARFSIAIDGGLWWTQIGNASINTGTPIINTWNYLAVTFNGSTLTLYVNGASIGTVATSTSAQNTTLTIGTLGSSWAAGYFVTGYISNVRVSSVVRTIITPTAPYTSDASTRLLTCQSNRFLDNSANAFALTITGTPSVQSSTPFVPNTAYAAYGSTYFDGTGDYLTATLTGQTFGTGNFTAEGWFYITVHLNYNTLMTQRTTGASSTGWIVGLDSGGGVYAYSNGFLIGPTGTATLKVWNHVAFVRSSGTMTLYLNGVSLGTSATVKTFSDTAAGIGGDAGDAYTLNGYASNVRYVVGTAVYTTTFTPPSAPLTAITNTSLLTCQTNQPVNNSVFLDSSTNALAVTRVGNTSAGTFSPYGANWSVYQSDVLSDQLGFTTSVGTSFQFTGNFTIEGWVYYTTLSGDASFYVISDGSTYLAFNISMSAGVYNIYLNSGSPTSSFAHGISVGVWTHVAMVRSGSTVTLYTNGVSKGTITNSNTLGYSAPSINRTGGGVSGVIRYISNIRVVKGTAVYTGNFTPSTTPLTAIANTVLLTCQSNRFVDNSTNAFVATITGNVAVQRFSPFGPSAAYTASTIGGSAYFDGSGDYLTTPSSSLFNLNGINWTVEGWFNLVSATSDDRLFVFAGASVSWGFYRRAATGNIYFGQMGTDEALLGNMLLNEWTHLALVRTSGPTISLYKNGVFSASTAAYSMPNENCTFLIAGNPAPYVLTVTKGYVSDVRVVKGTAVYTSNFVPPTAPLTAVTNTSLLLNMTSAGVYDSARMNSLETAGDAKILSTQTPYAGSYYSNYFDGTGDYLTAGTTASNFLCTGSATGITATLEAWVYPTAYNTNGSPWMFSSVHSKGNVYFNFGVRNGAVRFYWFDGTNPNTVDSASTNNVPLNTWTHIAVTISGTTIKIYVNGTLNTTSATYNGVAAAGSGGTENISIELNVPTYFSGYISNYRLNNTVVYTSTFTPSITPLTAITGTNLLTCQSNRFVDNSTNAFAVTRTGDTSVQSFNPFQRNSATTMSFDGTGDWLVPRNLLPLGNGNFTVEMWLYPNATYSGAYAGILDSRTSGDGVGLVYFGYTGTANQIGWKDNTTNVVTGSVTLSTWNHVAIVRSNGTMTMYVNGTSTSSSANSTNYTVAFRLIGASFDPLAFNGYINDLRITKGVARYTATFTPPTTAFITK